VSIVRLFYRPVRPLLALPERYPAFTIISIGVVFALAYGAGTIAFAKPDGRIVVGDALGHYVQLRSAVFDRDLRFRNDYARMYGLEEGSEVERSLAEPRLTPTGYTRNFMPVGPALLWAPAFLLVAAGVWLVNLFGAGYPLDGYAPAFQAAAGFTGVAAAVAGNWLAYSAAARLFGRRAAIWATLALWLSSSAVYYTVISPTYSHAASMLAAGAFWLVWVRTLDRQTAGRYLLVGVLAGVAALMRWQDAILLLVPAIDAARHWRDGGVGAAATRILASAAGAAIAFLPQVAVWTVLYNQPFTVPQGSGFMRWGDPALWAILVSDNHGLLTWTPIAALALAGFVPLIKRYRTIGVAALVVFVVSWYVNAAVSDWWAGEAFGARRFLSCYPVLVMALAALFEKFGERRGALAATTLGFTVCTFLLLLQYQAFMHGLRDVVPYPRGFVDLWLWRFRVPFDLAAWWLGRT
jgi:hypothetical protein